MPGKIKVIFKDTQKVEEVKHGYAVNLLLPQGLAVLATEEALLSLEKQNKAKEKKLKQKQKREEAIAKKIEASTLRLKAKVKDGKKLFGSITPVKIKKEIEKILEKEKMPTPPKLEVVLDSPIKEKGEYKIPLKIGQSRAKLRVVIDEA